MRHSTGGSRRSHSFWHAEETRQRIKRQNDEAAQRRRKEEERKQREEEKRRRRGLTKGKESLGRKEEPERRRYFLEFIRTSGGPADLRYLHRRIDCPKLEELMSSSSYKDDLAGIRATYNPLIPAGAAPCPICWLYE